jgi:uncharacterized protein (DUF58 family)
MAKSATGKVELLDTATLARLSSMQLLAKAVVEGFILGLHKSPFRGFSVEFAEYRAYAPGDDIKHIDWKVYAKTDRYYVKLFEEETNLACHVVLDASGSMAYGSQPLTKLQYATRMAACLLYFMMGQRDAAGLAIFDTGLRTFLPARLRQSHLQHILSTLEECQPGKETDLARPLHDVAEAIKKRGLVVVISDLLGDIPALSDALQHLRFAGHDIIVFQVLDPHETEFPFEQVTEFTDLESGEKVTTSGRSIRDQYLKDFEAHQAAIRDALADLRIDYALFDTRMPLDVALAEYLYKRARTG